MKTKQESCPSHGEYEAELYHRDQNGIEYFRDCPACREERWRGVVWDLIDASNIPMRYKLKFDLALKKDALLAFEADTEGRKAAWNAADEFIVSTDTEYPCWLVLSGGTGTGKTLLMAASLWACATRENSVLYLTAPDLIQRLREAWRKDSPRSESKEMEFLCKEIDVLGIDEVGVGFGTDAEAAQLFRVIDARYAACRPTILATNLNGDGLDAYLGPRAMDRFREVARWVTFDWESYRSNAKTNVIDIEVKAKISAIEKRRKAKNNERKLVI